MDITAARHGRGVAEPRAVRRIACDDVASGRRSVLLGLERSERAYASTVPAQVRKSLAVKSPPDTSRR